MSGSWLEEQVFEGLLLGVWVGLVGGVIVLILRKLLKRTGSRRMVLIQSTVCGAVGGWLIIVLGLGREEDALIGASILTVIYMVVALGRSPRASRESERVSKTSEAEESSSARAQTSTPPGTSQRVWQRPPISTTATEEYDVFISYRRQHGAETARLIRSAFKDQGLRAFLDVDDLQAGHFDQELLSNIAETPNFVIVLTPQALERCAAENDWLRQEIVQAMKTDRNIVPILMPGFEFPDPRALPSEIRGLQTYQSIGYSHEFFEAMVERLVRYLR